MMLNRMQLTTQAPAANAASALMHNSWMNPKPPQAMSSHSSNPGGTQAVLVAEVLAPSEECAARGKGRRRPW